MKGTLARIAVAAGTGLLLFVVVLLALLPGKGAERAGGTSSVAPDGWRALFFLCEELGFPVAAWDGAPGELPAAGTALLLSALPGEPPGAPRAPGAPLRARDPANYGRFVAEGGTLVFLCDDADDWDELVLLTELASLTSVTASSRVRAELALELADGERFTLEPGAFVVWSGAGLEELAGATLAPEVPVRAGESEPEPEDTPEEPERVTVAARESLGKGSLVLVGLEPDTFANGALEATPENALLFVRLLESLGPCERILFDQYALGAFAPPSRLELLLSPALLPASLHLAAWFALFLLAVAWVGPFARDPEPLLATAPLARARAQGGLLRRAGRFDLLAGLLRRGLLERWSARAGMRTRGAEADLAQLVRGDRRRLARARELLLGPPPVDGRDFTALARSLASFERELAASTRAGKDPRTPSTPSP